jgi:DNA-binding response OmpR family regulator
MQNGDRSVLVVEDDPSINTLVCTYVEIAGLKCRSVLNGTTALRDAHEHTPSAVLLDLMLPDIDGFEVCKQLKADETTRAVPIIMLTALSDDKSRERGLACGASEYIVKPFNPDRLLAALAQYAGEAKSP